jgi:hypothetical protein
MADFTKYMHLERLGTTAVEGINVGDVYVFTKLDGTNAQVFHDTSHSTLIGCGSRNRKLEEGNDNAGFMNWAIKQDNLKAFVKDHPNLILYGEWLVPHSLKTYRDDAWRKFYIFDVYDTKQEKLLHFEEYKHTLKEYETEETILLHPFAIVKTGSVDHFYSLLEHNTYAIKDGEGHGEGIVLKNYEYKNRFGNQIWAKLVSSSFKEDFVKAMGPIMITDKKEAVEYKIVNKYVTQELVDKAYAKINLIEDEGFTSRSIPRLLTTVYYDLILEETWEFLKEHKQPTIDFKLLQSLTIARIKKLRSDIFS